MRFMRFKFLSLGLFSLSTVLALGTTTIKPAQAVCTATDVNVQVGVSREPAEQNNEASAEFDENCYNNNSTHTSTQVGQGDRVRQNRRSEHKLGGREGDNKLREMGIDTPNIYTPVDVRVNVPTPEGALERR
ncbi:MAG: hypothetical protein CLLPBCKN_007930 [Chroococcidiopsis cubana SAG 39.79]|uniref:Uncharacterized protein n=3 Tax=Chroococcidiopsidaceae TaxID=1890528 RepID=K9U7L5_CHRTP|nr:hypothetical protein Chro_5045 [Chroococcidiopsis thermalis PCC 7203]MDZ4878495.1 hypothetical protein [Chroococcidiopsis cubana SAG 39.79]RUT11521.1 hypothetical protein DSM107010_31730 [Chroococcidiopsis cubana SAG 39.79]